MDFEWDENKNEINWQKHRVDFADAIHVFLDESRLEREDTRKSYGESRFQTVGMTEQGVLFVIYTTRKHNKIRIISARRANSRERKSYDKGYLKPYPKEV